MAGGSGERFWPLSRKLRPKQLLRLGSDERVMLQEALDRIGHVFPIENTFILTSAELVEATLAACPNFPADQIIAEPMRRNTAGCLTYFAALTQQWGPDVTMAVFPADHRIAPVESFGSDVQKAMQICESESSIVAIGIVPTRPDTGFGYIEAGPAANASESPARQAKRFHEKPSLQLAEEYVADPSFFWNSGMFFWTTKTFAREIELTSPRHHDAFADMTAQLARDDRDSLNRTFAALPDISIDYALLERARQISVLPASFDWDDMGSWDALARYQEEDSRGNVAVGDTVLVRTADCIVHNSARNVTIALQDVYDLLVVATDDAVLVCDRAKSQTVRDVVTELKRRESKKI